MQTHPVLGAQILAGIPYLGGCARDVVVSHHERWDGRGYPHGLAGKEIPLVARIFAVVDAFDAMTNDRSYRRALSTEAALEEIVRSTGTHFDPHAAPRFASLVAGSYAA